VGAGRFLGEGSGREAEQGLEADGELGMEIMGIFSQPCHAGEAALLPPPRNSNPLVKDTHFSDGRAHSDRDALTSSLAHSLASQQLDGMHDRSATYDCRTPSQ